MRSKKNKNLTDKEEICLNLTQDDIRAMKRYVPKMEDEEYLEFLSATNRVKAKSDLRERKGPRGEPFEL